MVFIGDYLVVSSFLQISIACPNLKPISLPKCLFRFSSSFFFFFATCPMLAAYGKPGFAFHSKRECGFTKALCCSEEVSFLVPTNKITVTPNINSVYK